jgi:futalosine hydrolase
MKLLLCIPSLTDYPHAIAQLEATAGQRLAVADTTAAQYIYPIRYLQHEIDICVTGRVLHQLIYRVTRALAMRKYHLALLADTCGSYRADIPVGTMVNIIKDKPAYTGIATLTGDADLYEAGWDTSDTFPHIRGSLVNLNNSYMNVLLPLRKVVAVTVGMLRQPDAVTRYRDKYQADVETATGVGFVYACLAEGQPFYHISMVAYCLLDHAPHTIPPIDLLNDSLIDILQKL